MNAIKISLLFVSASAVALAPAAWAQRQPAPAKGPLSKLYVAEVKGESQVQNGEQIFELKQATALDAAGTVIETKAKSHDALVYSNGTGLFVDENSRVEINRFVQEPFPPRPAATLDPLNEPSVSQSNVHIARGAVGICTNRLISGSSMLYTTPHGTINIRGGRLTIAASTDETVIDLLEGDVTVRAGARDVGGQVLRPGERAIIRPPAVPGGEPTITLQPIPPDAMPIDDARVEMACNARRSVTFEAIGKAPTDNGDEAAGAAADQQIVARPTVPSDPPNNIVISPDRLPGT